MNMVVNDLAGTAARKYQEIVELQGGIRQKPRKLKTMKFELIPEDETAVKDEERYHQENTKHDHNIFEKYQTYLKKYNNTAEMLNKVSNFLKEIDEDFIIEFEVDKENYTTAAIAPYEGRHAEGIVYLWKSTYEKPDFIKYKFTTSGDCKILKIFSQEPPVGHKSFMFDVLLKSVEEYNNTIIREKYESVKDVRQVISRVVADLSENRKDERAGFLNFFRKKGFEFKEDVIYKELAK